MYTIVRPNREHYVTVNSPEPISTPGYKEGTVKVKCLAQEHDAGPQAAARIREPRPPDQDPRTSRLYCHGFLILKRLPL